MHVLGPGLAAGSREIVHGGPLKDHRIYERFKLWALID